jgi:hypothetical protein
MGLLHAAFKIQALWALNFFDTCLYIVKYNGDMNPSALQCLCNRCQLNIPERSDSV